MLTETVNMEVFDQEARAPRSVALSAGTKLGVALQFVDRARVTTQDGRFGEVPASALREVWRVVLPADAAAVTQANNQFACDLYRELRSGDGNLFFSPLSIHTALAMTWAGASGQNETEMAQTLHLTLPQARVHSALGRLHQALVHDEQVSGFSLSVANRLWGKTGYQFVPQFLATTREHYGAELAPVNFENPAQAAATINAWVAQQTRNKIQDLVPPDAIDPVYQRLILTNAVYFKADWEEPFDIDDTRPGPFHLLSGDTIEVPLMRKTDGFRWRQGDGFKLVEMPYGQAQLSMFVLLPDAHDGLAALETELTEANLRRWHGELHPASVQVTLPRFKLESSFRLNETLGKLGMARAFTQQNDNFLGIMRETPQWLTDVLHKAYVDVNEQGTEAAAATSVGAAGGTASLPPRFIADHPFVFLIRDNLSGAILFLARVVDPRG